VNKLDIPLVDLPMAYFALQALKQDGSRGSTPQLPPRIVATEQ
jgi:hypothetical protein